MRTQKQPRVLFGLAAAALAVSLGGAPVGLSQEMDKDEAHARALEHPSGPHNPPETLRLVGDHWTPYDPPAPESFPQGSTVHIIVPGDTLSALAGHYLNDPYFWPQIWDVNQYISDSHWIYPGDPVLIPGQPTVISEDGPPAIELIEPPASMAEGTPATTTPGMPPAAPPASPGMPPGAPPVTPATPGSASADLEATGPVLTPVADEYDIYCSTYILDTFEKPDLHIFEREAGAKTVMATGDIVFLNKGLEADIAPGDEFTIITEEGVVHHPIYDEKVGESVRMIGRLRIIALQERTATAMITQACDAIEVGMQLIPFKEIPIPLTTPVDFRRYGVEINTDTAGYIIDSSPRKLTLAAGDIVNVDLGSERGLQPGDILTVFREWGGSVTFASTESYIEGQQARAERNRRANNPPEDFAQSILGQMVVLTTQENTATAKITLAERGIVVGDRVSRN